MGVLIQKLHPALRLGQQVMVAKSRAPLFSRQGDWDGGSTHHCVAMALALLGKLSNPAEVWRSHNVRMESFRLLPCDNQIPVSSQRLILK